MSCECEALSDSILKGCLDNAGGLKRLWLYNHCAATVADSSPTGYKELTLTGLTGKLYKFEFNKGNANYTELQGGEEANGVQFYTQTVSIKLNRREKSKRAIIVAMSKFRKLGAVIEDNNGLFWLLGEVDGLVLTGNEGGSGAQKADHNGYTLTLVGEETEAASEISSAHFASLVSGSFVDEQ
jgi:hypothetical protein